MRWPLQPLQPVQETQLQPPFRSISGFTLPCVIHKNQTLLYVFFSETSATALCGTTGIYVYVNPERSPDYRCESTVGKRWVARISHIYLSVLLGKWPASCGSKRALKSDPSPITMANFRRRKAPKPLDSLDGKQEVEGQAQQWIFLGCAGPTNRIRSLQNWYKPDNPIYIYIYPIYVYSYIYIYIYMGIDQPTYGASRTL